MKTRLYNVILGWFLVVSAIMAQNNQHSCKSTEERFELSEIAPMVEASVADGLDLSSEDQELIYKIRELGPKAIPHLLLLLEHKNKDVRSRTTHILDEIDDLTNEHLDKLLFYVNEGNWDAIGRAGTPEAISFLIAKLKDVREERRSSSALIQAFVSAGDRAIPSLIRLFKFRDVDPALLFEVVDIFDAMGREAYYAIDPLCKIAQDDNLEILVRLLAVDALGRIGITAQGSIPSLKNLAETNPDVFEYSVVEAFMNMRSPEAVDYLVRDLPASPDLYKFKYIAEIGVDAVAAGPELVQYLNHPDWEVRTVAARALGYIGYSDASQPLIEALGNTNCWRLVYVAAESLGRLKAKNSISTLTRLSREHWYPPVRDMAKDAIIKSNDTSGFDSNNSDTRFDAYDYVKLDPLNPLNSGVAIDADDCFVTPEGVLKGPELAGLSYETWCFTETGKKYLTQIPEVGIVLEDGYLVGSARGQWGGELIFIDADGNRYIVLNTNIEGIYRTPEGILVTAGGGRVYKVSKDDRGNWSATKWKGLPGIARSSALLKDGSLYIECVGGNIVLAPDGTIKMAHLKGGEKKQLLPVK